MSLASICQQFALGMCQTIFSGNTIQFLLFILIILVTLILIIELLR